MYYMTVEELTALLPSIFTSNELLEAGVDTFTPDDLKAILGQSEGFLDSLRYKGCFVEDYQQHAFPRKVGADYVIDKDNERVQKALCCIAYDFMKQQKLGTSRIDLVRQGVKSISTAGVSESYGDISEIEKNKISDNYVKYLGFCLFKGVL